MLRGKTKFQIAWLSKELDSILIKEWCKPTKDCFHATCILCSERFDISNSGFSQLKSHHNGKKHKFNFETRFFGKSISESFLQSVSTTSTNEAKPNSLLSQDMQLNRAEALWALHVANRNLSFKFCNETDDLFKLMFPDSQIAVNMHLKEKKVAYVISHGLNLHFAKELKLDLKNSSGTGVTIAFDETTNIMVKKQLDAYVRYYSSEVDAVSCRYLGSIFMGHATSDKILQELLNVLTSNSITIENVICLSLDGPNVNKSMVRALIKKGMEELNEIDKKLSTVDNEKQKVVRKKIKL